MSPPGTASPISWPMPPGLRTSCGWWPRCAPTQYDLPLQHTTLGPVVSASTFAVTPMTAAELQDAIVVPAERVGVRFEPGLVSTMVGDVVSRPGALPLLQFTLTELFERRQNATVTAEAYEDLGGIGGALARRAEDLYEATAVEQRDDVHRLFTQLVTPGDDSDDLRRRATVEELADIAPRVIEEYRSNRLIVTDHHPVTREPTVEVAHEALLREWPRLAGWIDGDRDTIRVRRSLTLAAHDWQADPADESTLYRGTRLVAADQVARTLTVTGGERDFLAASHELADRDRRREADQLERTARANRRLRAQLVALAVFLVVAVVAGLAAVRQRDRAQESAADADAAAVAADARRVGAQALVDEALDRSLLLAVEGVRLDDAPDTRANLLAALSRSPALVGSAGVGEPLWALDVSPDGELVAVGGAAVTAVSCRFTTPTPSNSWAPSTSPPRGSGSAPTASRSPSPRPSARASIRLPCSWSTRPPSSPNASSSATSPRRVLRGTCATAPMVATWRRPSIS